LTIPPNTDDLRSANELADDPYYSGKIYVLLFLWGKGTLHIGIFTQFDAVFNVFSSLCERVDEGSL